MTYHLFTFEHNINAVIINTKKAVKIKLQLFKHMYSESKVFIQIFLLLQKFN